MSGSQTNDVVIAYMTVPDKGSAHSIATTLLREKLVACVNIIPGVSSLFFWEGKLCDSCECLLMAKTIMRNTDRLVTRFREIHPYDLPCSLILPVLGGDNHFLNWVTSETIPV